jgi:hypothetical protein
VVKVETTSNIAKNSLCWFGILRLLIGLYWWVDWDAVKRLFMLSTIILNLVLCKLDNLIGCLIFTKAHKYKMVRFIAFENEKPLWLFLDFMAFNKTITHDIKSIYIVFSVYCSGFSAIRVTGTC